MNSPSELPPDVAPQWIMYVASLVFGAGGVHLLRVYLESRRLGQKEYRDVLLDRVRELELMVKSLQETVSDLRVHNARLEQRLERSEFRDDRG